MAKLKRASAPRRARSEKKPAPKVKVLRGDPVPNAVPGLVPGFTRVSEFGGRRTTQLRLSTAEPEPKGKIEIADEMLLAQHLVRDLSNFIQHGDNVFGIREIVDPILKKYAELKQDGRDSNLAHCFADLAWDIVEGKRDAAAVLATAKQVRREESWFVNDEPISVEAIKRAAALPRRGPAPSPLQRAARVYAALAWNSRASVQPTRLDRRESRNRALQELLESHRRTREFFAQSPRR